MCDVAQTQVVVVVVVVLVDGDGKKSNANCNEEQNPPHLYSVDTNTGADWRHREGIDGFRSTLAQHWKFASHIHM